VKEGNPRNAQLRTREVEVEVRDTAFISGVVWLNEIFANSHFAPDSRLILDEKIIPE
jgi:hypothetical protein